MNSCSHVPPSVKTSGQLVVMRCDKCPVRRADVLDLRRDARIGQKAVSRAATIRVFQFAPPVFYLQFLFYLACLLHQLG